MQILDLRKAIKRKAIMPCPRFTMIWEKTIVCTKYKELCHLQ